MILVIDPKNDLFSDFYIFFVGVYTCVATTKLDSASKSVTITIEGEEEQFLFRIGNIYYLFILLTTISNKITKFYISLMFCRRASASE